MDTQEKQQLKDELLLFKDDLQNLIGIVPNTPQFLTSNLCDIVKNIDDVYRLLGRYKPTESNYSFLPIYKIEKALNTQYITDITELFNKGWKPDFTNSSEYKYIPYFERKGSGWVLILVHISVAFSFDGSGFYYQKKEDAEFCAKLFLDIYSKVLE